MLLINYALYKLVDKLYTLNCNADLGISILIKLAEHLNRPFSPQISCNTFCRIKDNFSRCVVFSFTVVGLFFSKPIKIKMWTLLIYIKTLCGFSPLNNELNMFSPKTGLQFKKLLLWFNFAFFCTIFKNGNTCSLKYWSWMWMNMILED